MSSYDSVFVLAKVSNLSVGFRLKEREKDQRNGQARRITTRFSAPFPVHPLAEEIVSVVSRREKERS